MSWLYEPGGDLESPGSMVVVGSYFQTEKLFVIVIKKVICDN